MVENVSTEERHNDLGWSEDKSDDYVVENVPEPNVEDVDNKMKSSIEKQFKPC